MRPLASSDISEILAEIAHAMCSVTAIERALSSNIGKRVINSRMVFLSHTSTQLPASTSVLARYCEGAARMVTPPKNCPVVNQCRMIFRPALVMTNCLPCPLVRRNIRSAGSSRSRITEMRGKCWWVAADKIKLTSVVVNPQKSRGLRRPGKPITRLSSMDVQAQFTRGVRGRQSREGVSRRVDRSLTLA
jgi:hypothetical protein